MVKVRIPQDLKDRLKVKAAQEKITLTALITRILTKSLFLLFFIGGTGLEARASEDQWLCTSNEPSQRHGSSLYICGTGYVNGYDHEAAKLLAFQEIEKEFNRLCAAEGSCSIPRILDPARTECTGNYYVSEYTHKRVHMGTTCHRLIIYSVK